MLDYFDKIVETCTVTITSSPFVAIF